MRLFFEISVFPPKNPEFFLNALRRRNELDTCLLPSGALGPFTLYTSVRCFSPFIQAFLWTTPTERLKVLRQNDIKSGLWGRPRSRQITCLHLQLRSLESAGARA